MACRNTTVITLLFTLFFTLSLHAQDEKQMQKEREKVFVEKTFTKSRDFSDDDALKKTYDTYKEKQTDKNFQKYEKRAKEVSWAKDIEVIITITTATPGAIVKYKPIDGAEPFTGSQPTNSCQLKLPLGYCIIWTERNGHRTSENNKILVIDDEIKFIPENLQ